MLILYFFWLSWQYQVEGEIEQEISQKETHLQNEVASQVQTHQTELEQRSTDLQDYIHAESIPAITEMVSEFANRLEEGVDQLTQKTQELGESTEKSAQESIDQFKQSQGDVFDELMNMANELKQMMEQLSDLVDTGGATVVTAKDEIVGLKSAA